VPRQRRLCAGSQRVDVSLRAASLPGMSQTYKRANRSVFDHRSTNPSRSRNDGHVKGRTGSQPGLAADLQKSLTVLFDGIDEHINGLLDGVVTSANNAFWSVPAVNR
jgi:hypothetical protein